MGELAGDVSPLFMSPGCQWLRVRFHRMVEVMNWSEFSGRPPRWSRSTGSARGESEGIGFISPGKKALWGPNGSHPVS